MKAINLGRVVIMAALLLSFSTRVFPQLREYPRWFIFPGEFPGLITGITNKGNSALQDAAITATAYKKCIVDGTLRVISKQDISFPHRASDYFYYYPEEEYKAIRAKLRPVDSLVTNLIRGESITLFTINDGPDSVQGMVKTADLVRPDWIDSKVSYRDDYYWSVGSFTARGNENDSWKTAEERAIFAVLLTLEIEVNSETIVDNTAQSYNEYEKTIDFKVKQLLTDISVVERYPDPGSKLNYVLIKLKTGK